MSREQRREHTRSHLLEAAGRVFARRGLAHASVDEVAADAGFTKGAVYANFRSKEELFLAMLEARFERRAQEMDRILRDSKTVTEGAREAAADFIAYLDADPDWERLFFEAALHASRDEPFRRRLAGHYVVMRQRMADVLEIRGRELGIEPAVPWEQLATMFFAMGNGIAFERIVEPGAVPEGFFGTMLELFTRGATRPHAD